MINEPEVPLVINEPESPLGGKRSERGTRHTRRPRTHPHRKNAPHAPRRGRDRGTDNERRQPRHPLLVLSRLSVVFSERREGEGGGALGSGHPIRGRVSLGRAVKVPVLGRLGHGGAVIGHLNPFGGVNGETRGGEVCLSNRLLPSRRPLVENQKAPASFASNVVSSVSLTEKSPIVP